VSFASELSAQAQQPAASSSSALRDDEHKYILV